MLHEGLGGGKKNIRTKGGTGWRQTINKYGSVGGGIMRVRQEKEEE